MVKKKENKEKKKEKDMTFHDIRKAPVQKSIMPRTKLYINIP